MEYLQVVLRYINEPVDVYPYLIQPLFVVSIPHIHITIRATSCKSTMAANYKYKENISLELSACKKVHS